MPAFLVREAVPDDAPDAIDVLRASITNLCVDDHLNDPQTLDLWLRNKTLRDFQSWVDDAEVHLVVAAASTASIGVGSIHSSGWIHLLYVRPGSQRVGVGAAILRALEERAASWGLREIGLGSSVGARSFYEHHGYASTGPPMPGFGVSRIFPYAKRIPDATASHSRQP